MNEFDIEQMAVFPQAKGVFVLWLEKHKALYEAHRYYSNKPYPGMKLVNRIWDALAEMPTE